VAAGRDRGHEVHGEQPGAGADVGDHHARLQAEHLDDYLGPALAIEPRLIIGLIAGVGGLGGGRPLGLRLAATEREGHPEGAGQRDCETHACKVAAPGWHRHDSCAVSILPARGVNRARCSTRIF